MNNQNMQRITSSGMVMGATLSPCGKYRYQLWRVWNPKLPKCLFLMHNPSTADAFIEDPTIRRCINFAKDWGYGGIYVGNLSPYRATDPKDLLKTSQPLIPWENCDHLYQMTLECQIHVLAYGVPVKGILTEQYKDFISAIANWHYLKLTKDNYPCHPLYLKRELTPQQL